VSVLKTSYPLFSHLKHEVDLLHGIYKFSSYLTGNIDVFIERNHSVNVIEINFRFFF
jgi:hypothetical protein